MLRTVADLAEHRGAKGFDLDSGEVVDWLRAEAEHGRGVMTLPYDIARCPGAGRIEDGEQHWREGCEDCLRRTSPGHPTRQVYMAPPPIIVFECEYRIGPA